MTTVPDFRFDQPANVQTVTPAMYRARALAFLAAHDDWTPLDDLKLFEALGRGDSLEVAAKKVGVPPVMAVRRYRAWRDALTTRDYIPQAAQTVLLDVLRAAVGRVS
jgi:hypothetical protein